MAVGKKGPCDTVHRVWPPRAQAGRPGTAAARRSHGQKSLHESTVTMAVTVVSEAGPLLCREGSYQVLGL